MTVKEAVVKARESLIDLIDPLDTKSIRLEETEYHEEKKQWDITFSFVAIPVSYPFIPDAAIYKIITISESTGEFVAMKIRSFD